VPEKSIAKSDSINDCSPETDAEVTSGNWLIFRPASVLDDPVRLLENVSSCNNKVKSCVSNTNQPQT